MRVPTATYRIQFNPSFRLKEAQEIVPYLTELGISDIYASPIFKARRGSSHGYDVVDPNKINPELGSPADFDALLSVLQLHGMGWLQDIVPNHMAYDFENRMLMDVMENGQRSPYAHFFDIEWDHPYESLKGRILAPFLGRFYGECLESGDIKLEFDAHGFLVRYYGIRLPLKIESYLRVLTFLLDKLERELSEDTPDLVQLLGILDATRALPSVMETEQRQHHVNLIKTALRALYEKSPTIKRFIRKNIDEINGQPGHAESFQWLDDLLSEQNFKLSFWKVATEEINYRRFFNVNDLISVRLEDEEVFASTHALILRLVTEGKITGLRIDHVDGLYDPTQYLDRIKKQAGDIYLLVEKICALDEDLPSDWPVQGTTGYDFLNWVNGIFCARENARQFRRLYAKFTKFDPAYEDLVAEKKRLITGKHMAGDIDNLAHLLKAASSRDRFGGDITLYGLKRALVEVMAHFPVYRTYISREQIRKADYDTVRWAIHRAIQGYPGLSYELRFIERLLLFQWGDGLSEEEKEQWVHFARRFQQITGPLMAKGFEDTTLYIYNRLLSLNEVGGDPSRFGLSTEEFHRFNAERVKSWPHAMNATSTHDTKRGEDVRARLDVLSELPGEWEKNIKIWSALNRKKKKRVNGIPVPDKNDEYFLYQTLLGAYPFDLRLDSVFLDRVKAYIIKAVREAKVHTAWLKPDEEYENAFLSFIETILNPKEDNRFLQAWLPFQEKVAHYGMFNSLSQTLIKMTAPGVPDFYQGTELWDLSLVDPDNRRPVDFKGRKAWLRGIVDRAESDILLLVRKLLETRKSGKIKLFLIHRCLRHRNAHADLFRDGEYGPLDAAGRFGAHIVAFARQHRNEWAITIAPRFLTAVVKKGEDPLGLEKWQDTHLTLPENAPRLWKDVITDQPVICNTRLMMGDVLRCFPVSLIWSEGNS